MQPVETLGTLIVEIDMTKELCGMHHYPVIRDGRCIGCIVERRKALCPDGHKKVKHLANVGRCQEQYQCDNCGEVFEVDSSD